MIYFRSVARIDAVLAQWTRIDMPRIDERDAAAARAIFRESEELKNVLKKELKRLENNETFVAEEFQKGVVRALIDLTAWSMGLQVSPPNSVGIEYRRGAAGARSAAPHRSWAALRRGTAGLL